MTEQVAAGFLVGMAAMFGIIVLGEVVGAFAHRWRRRDR